MVSRVVRCVCVLVLILVGGVFCCLWDDMMLNIIVISNSVGLNYSR